MPWVMGDTLHAVLNIFTLQAMCGLYVGDSTNQWSQGENPQTCEDCADLVMSLEDALLYDMDRNGPPKEG